MNVYKEDFASFSHLLTTIEKRTNNRYMRDKHESQESDYDFTRTHSYDEARQLLRAGYKEVVPKIQRKLRESQKISSQLLAMLPKDQVHNMPVGFIPHVPNAIRGLPDSMINIEKADQKRKVIDVFYSMHGSWVQDTDWFVNAGAALVSAINIVETAGIQTKLHLAFATTECNDQILFPSIVIKNFGERFSIQKVSFPLVHPSMFRRIGFRYIETCPGMEEDFSRGYGHALQNRKPIQEAINNNHTVYIDTKWINDHNCDIKSILQEMGVFKSNE